MFRYSAHKYNAKKCTYNGIKFDSLAERDYYLILLNDPTVKHIDCHVIVTLPGGLRLNIDFFVWREDTVEAVEIKGKILQEFKRLRQLFDETHPLRPMTVYQKKGKFYNKI